MSKKVAIFLTLSICNRLLEIYLFVISNIKELSNFKESRSRGIEELLFYVFQSFFKPLIFRYEETRQPTVIQSLIMIPYLSM